MNNGTTTIPNIGFVMGAYGDMEDCEGILERVEAPESGGTFMKFYGCTYLFKGFPISDVIENIGLAKALISLLPREILGRSKLIVGGLILMFVVNKRKFYGLLNLYFDMIYSRTVAKAKLPRKRYNKFTTELMRISDIAFTNELVGVNTTKPLVDYCALEVSDHKVLRKMMFLAKAVSFVCFFLEIDNAYRFRMQDVLSLVNKYNAERNIIDEVNRLFDVLIDREVDESLRAKWLYLRKRLVPILYVSPMFRRMLRTMIREMDVDQIKLDEDDWYFCLRRKGYWFGGRSLEDRLKEKERLDKERKHTLLRFVYKNEAIQISDTTQK